MVAENLSYALVQVLHNFGAAGVVGIPLFALAAGAAWSARRRRLLWLVLLAWGAQAVSGAGFGAVSYHFYGQFPDISGVATSALAIKIGCLLLGLGLAAAALRFGTERSEARQRHVWQALGGLGIVALTAAAFLRWFS